VDKKISTDNLPLAFLEGTLRLSKYGIWYHDNQQFTHAGIISLFHRSIIWSEDERRYLLKIGKMMASFTIEDTAYFVRSLDDSEYSWWLDLLDGRRLPFDPHQLKIGPENQFYSTVSDKCHRARWLRPAHQTLLMHASSDSSISYQGREWSVAVVKEG